MASSRTLMSLIPSKLFQRRGSRLVRRTLVQELSIKRTINSRRRSTRLKQGSSWIWNVRRFMEGSTSVRSSLSFWYPPKIFLSKSGQIPLLLSTFILIKTFIVLTGSRRLRQLLRRERLHIFGTTRVLIMMPYHLFEKCDSNKNKRGNVCHLSLYWKDSSW